LISKIKQEWKTYLSIQSFRIQFIFSFAGLVLLLVGLSRFLIFIENRNGSILNDPILALFSPHDFTWLIFTIIYFSVIVTLFYLLDKPVQVLKGLQIYSLMIIFRIIAMYLIPLDPPSLMIELNDPLVEIIGGTGKTLTKDLFFSGHTATLFILYLVVEKKGFLKNFLLASTLIIASLVLLQHIHYSIDVFTAFFISYTCFKIVTQINNKLMPEIRNYSQAHSVNKSHCKKESRFDQ
jgi:hypothetical protein